MIQQDFPATARRAALHCEALTRRSAPKVDPLPVLDRLGERLCRTLGPTLGCLWGETRATAQFVGSRWIDTATLGEACAKPSAISVLSIGPASGSLLLTIDGPGLMQRLNRAFGGPGEIDDPITGALPLPADLMAQRMEERFATALGEALPEANLRRGPRGVECDIAHRFTPSTTLAMLEIGIADDGLPPLTLSLALDAGAVEFLLPGKPVRSGHGKSPDATIAQSRLANVPLEARATLIDMTLPLRSVARLRPGAVLPVLVARSVPLRVESLTIGHGAIGNVDERRAIQITNTFSTGKEAL